MQWMHQSYKYMKAQQKKLSGCASNSLAHEDLGGILRKPIIGIYKPSSIMEDSHQYMKVTTQETLYNEDHGATLKHKCGKRIVALPLLSFSLIFWAFSLFYGLFSLFLFRLLWPFLFFFFFFFHGAMLYNDDHHTFIYLQLKNQNSILEQNMTLCECLRRCTGICNESRVTSMEKL